MGAKKETSFTVIFNKAQEQLPVAKANLAAADIPYEIVDQEWLAHDKSRARVTFRTQSKSDAKRLRKVIPIQPGLQCGAFVAAEYPEEARLSGREFEKKALELGYSKYSADIIRYRIERNPEPFDWKTVSREELEANPWFATYYRGGKPQQENRLVEILLGVQQGRKCEKQSTRPWRCLGKEKRMTTVRTPGSAPCTTMEIPGYISTKEITLWKGSDGWHGDIVEYGEWHDLSEEAATRIAVQYHLELPKVKVDRKCFKNAAKHLGGMTLEKLSSAMGYAVYRTFAREYESGYCDLDFAIRASSTLCSDIFTVFGEKQPYLPAEWSKRKWQLIPDSNRKGA